MAPAVFTMKRALSQSLALLAANSSNVTAPFLSFPQVMQQSWAQSSPYFPIETYLPPPSGCEVTQVVLLQRHGARYPTSSSGESQQASVAKLQAVSEFTNPSFDFIKSFNYTLGANDLVPFGAAQSYQAGYDNYGRYGNLVNASMIPFVRASDSERVVASATNWTAGFAYASDFQYNPVLNVIISESGNDTLNDGNCPAATSSKNETNEWVAVYTPNIIERFTAAAPGVNLTGTDIVNYMSLCTFETVTYETPSQWCDLFTDEEWSFYEYYGDVDDYYGNGYGNQLGPVQGVGWVNELIARLTEEPVHIDTNINSTLDENPATFPLNRTFYADFTHDNQMISIYSAMGLFEQPQPLNTLVPNPSRTWMVSKMVPFSARMITEKLTCDGSQEAYVRILVNDKVQPLEFCYADQSGMCTLSNFVDSQAYSQNNGYGQWNLCFETTS